MREAHIDSSQTLSRPLTHDQVMVAQAVGLSIHSPSHPYRLDDPDE